MNIDELKEFVKSDPDFPSIAFLNLTSDFLNDVEFNSNLDGFSLLGKSEFLIFKIWDELAFTTVFDQRFYNLRHFLTNSSVNKLNNQVISEESGIEYRIVKNSYYLTLEII